MPYLLFEMDNGEKQVIPLQEGVNTIGRHPSNQIVNDHKSLSRYHAQLVVRGSNLIISDNHSRNGTFINRQPIQQVALQDGDTIQCGDITYKLAFQDPNAPVAEAADLEILTRIQLDSPESSLHDLLQPHQGLQSLATGLRLESPFQPDLQQNLLSKLKILLEVSRELASLQNPAQLLDKILELLFEILEIDRAAILLINPKTGELEQQAAKCPSRRTTSKRFYSQRIVDFVRQTGDAIISRDAQTDRRFDEAISIFDQSIRASMCVPLKPKQGVIGVLYVDSLSRQDVYQESDLQFLTALANQAAIAIENTTLSHKLAAEAVMRSRMERFFPASVLHRMVETEEALWQEIVDTEVSALFVDISEFTQLSSTMEPRQVIGMLNEYFAVMVEGIVFPYAGTLEKYIGDALLAIWGAPYQLPDDADRAVNAAISMQHQIHALNEHWVKTRQLEIQIHIGINSGKVAAGNIGSPRLIQYATIGDTTNVASRICNVAKAGEIVISEETLNRLQNKTIPVVPLPPTKVKGKSAPLRLFKVLWKDVVPSMPAI
jgi:adenylate cyclase